MTVLVVAPAPALAALEPLVAVWRHTRGVVVHELAPGAVPTGLGELAGRAGADAVLLVGPRRRAPRTVLPGPVLATAAGPVPVGWLPDTGAADLARFARAAAQVHRRPAGPRTVGVLGQRLGRYDDLAARIVRILGERAGPVRVRRWTAYDLHRDDLVAALGAGPAAAVYVGHGRPVGWVGYAGLRARHVGPDVDAGWRPPAAVLSLSCHTASRRDTGLSFAEALPLRGAAAACLGAVTSTLHTANARWALRIAWLVGTVATVGELVLAAAAADPHAGLYRLVGDPTAPLRDAVPEAAA